MAGFFKTDFCPPVSGAGSIAGSAAAGAAVGDAGGGTSAFTVGGAAGSSTGGRERKRTGLGDGRTGVTGRGKGKHPVGQSEGWRIANGIICVVASQLKCDQHCVSISLKNSAISQYL